MVRVLYTAHTGMRNEQKRLDIISNNLANSATVGYKKESVTNQAFEQMLTLKIRDGSQAYHNQTIGRMSMGVKIGEVYTDYDQGSLRQTGNTYDLAISGNGFFSVKVTDAEGNSSIKYTRDGTFKLSADGYLMDSNGNRVQGSGGDITIPTNATSVAISKDGVITADGVVLDTISLIDFTDYDYLKKFGDNLYEPVEGATTMEAAGAIEQGYTEQSNVNVVSEMVNMIAITRAYEANQKIIKTVDTMLDKSVNSVGKL